MGKLNIAHHKSYHPYRRDNIERVRRDEEEARIKEAQEEGRMLLADAEARIALLRERASITSASSSKSKKNRKDDAELDLQLKTGESATLRTAELPTTNGHINFFEDLERSATSSTLTSATASFKHASSSKSKDAAANTNAKANQETEKGVPLAPSAKDLTPWYVSKEKNRPAEETMPEDRIQRDQSRKAEHDPLTSITRQLASRHGSSSSFKHPPLPSSSSGSRYAKSSMDPPSSVPSVVATSTSSNSGQPSSSGLASESRLAREKSERERALALIRRKQRERERLTGSETPSTIYGGMGGETPSTVDGGYSDQFNRREVEEAHKGWEKDKRDMSLSRRGWDEERDEERKEERSMSRVRRDEREERSRSRSRSRERRDRKRDKKDKGERRDRDRDRMDGGRDREKEREGERRLMGESRR